MYGISNSQQQGGGGGGAASYKAIKSTLTPSDWQEVTGATPYFVGENAMEWAVNEEYDGMKIKSSPSALGLQLGVDYTATIDVDNVTYTQTAQMHDPSETDGTKVLVFGFSENIFMYIYDDVAGIMPGLGDSFCAIPGGLTATSFVITKFDGEGFGTTIQATISDSAIKVNSAVTMYTNTSEKIAVGEKTNGNVTLIAPSIPTTEIPYSLEIVGTDTEGLFEIVNGYVPEIPDTPSGVPQWHTIYESSTPVIKAELSEAIQAGKLYKITIRGQEFITWAIDAENLVCSQTMLGTSNGVANSIYYNIIQFDCGIQSYDSTSTANTFKLKTTSGYKITTSGIQDVNFADNNTVTFTKVEVYR